MKLRKTELVSQNCDNIHVRITFQNIKDYEILIKSFDSIMHKLSLVYKLSKNWDNVYVT